MGELSKGMRRENLAYLLLICVAFVWGSTFVLIKAALADVSPLLFNFLRMTLAACALAIVYRRSMRGLPPAAWAMGVLTGVLLAAGYQLQTAGLTSTTPSVSAFLTGMVVLFVPLLSLSPRLRAPGTARPGPGAFLSAALGFAGLVLLAVPPNQPWAMHAVGRGELLTLACAFAFALHLLAIAHGSLRVPFQALATVQIGTAALAIGVCLPFFEPHPYLHLSPRFFAAWCIAALFATAAAFSIQSWAQGFLPASRIALIFTLEPVFAAATSFLVLHERLHGRSLVGAALVLAALLAAELFPTSGVHPTAHELPLETR